MKSNMTRKMPPVRKTSAVLTWTGLGLLATTAVASAAMNTLWTENFNSNPVTPAGAWTQYNAPDKTAFTWISADSNLSWYNGWDDASTFSRAAGLTLTDNTGFRYSLKLANSPEGEWSYYGAMDAGLTKAGGSDSARVRVAGSTSEGYWWSGTWYPTQYVFTPQIVTADGSTLSGTALSVGRGSDAYSVEVTYQAALRNLAFTLYDQTTSTTIGTSTITLGAADHFSLDTFALANVGNGGGAMYIRADDISLAVPEPAALSLLGLGLLALGGRRRAR